MRVAGVSWTGISRAKVWHRLSEPVFARPSNLQQPVSRRPIFHGVNRSGCIINCIYNNLFGYRKNIGIGESHWIFFFPLALPRMYGLLHYHYYLDYNIYLVISFCLTEVCYP